MPALANEKHMRMIIALFDFYMDKFAKNIFRADVADTSKHKHWALFQTLYFSVVLTLFYIDRYSQKLYNNMH